MSEMRYINLITTDQYIIPASSSFPLKRSLPAHEFLSEVMEKFLFFEGKNASTDDEHFSVCIWLACCMLRLKCTPCNCACEISLAISTSLMHKRCAFRRDFYDNISAELFNRIATNDVCREISKSEASEEVLQEEIESLVRTEWKLDSKNDSKAKVFFSFSYDDCLCWESPLCNYILNFYKFDLQSISDVLNSFSFFFHFSK